MRKETLEHIEKTLDTLNLTDKEKALVYAMCITVFNEGRLKGVEQAEKIFSPLTNLLKELPTK